MRGAGRAGVWSNLVLGSVLGVFSTSARAGAAEIEARGPAECPDGGELAFRVERNAKLSLERAPAVQFEIEMTRAAEAYVAHVKMTDASASQTKERVLQGTDCNQLGDAIVVAITLALGEAEAVEPGSRAMPAGAAESSGAPQTTSQVAPEANVPDRSEAPLSSDAGATPPAHERAPSLRPSLSVAVLGDLGSLPAPGVGAEIGAELDWGRIELRAFGLLLFEQHTELESPLPPAPGADLELFAGGVLACTTPFGAERAAWSIPMCLGFELGKLAGVGTGIADPRSGSALWAAPRVDAGLRWSLPNSPLRLSAMFTAATPLQRSRFALSEIGTVYSPSGVVGRLSLGIGIGFD